MNNIIEKYSCFEILDNIIKVGFTIIIVLHIIPYVIQNLLTLTVDVTINANLNKAILN